MGIEEVSDLTDSVLVKAFVVFFFDELLFFLGNFIRKFLCGFFNLLLDGGNILNFGILADLFSRYRAFSNGRRARA